jgi:hypothetical protein
MSNHLVSNHLLTKHLVSLALLAMFGFGAPAVAAASDVTEFSARKKFHFAPARGVRVAPSRALRVHGIAPRGIVRGPVRVNRAVVFRSPTHIRGYRGLRTTRIVGGRYNYGRFAVRPVRYGVYPRAAFYPRAALAATSMYRGPRSIYWGGRWRYYVPVAALGAIAIGSAYYYPDSYLSVARPSCSGVTANGCQLNWQMVGFEDGGGGGYQCVQYCPRPGAPPPVNVVALGSSSNPESSGASDAPVAPAAAVRPVAPVAAIPPAAAPQGQCEITLYSEPRFASAAVPTGDDQPKLSESGWENQIASLQIKAGNWELFTEEQYAGKAIRLAPGSYPELEPEWRKSIKSFMCVEPTG